MWSFIVSFLFSTPPLWLYFCHPLYFPSPSFYFLPLLSISLALLRCTHSHLCVPTFARVCARICAVGGSNRTYVLRQSVRSSVVFWLTTLDAVCPWIVAVRATVSKAVEVFLFFSFFFSLFSPVHFD